MVFYLFDRWDGQIGTILGVLSAKRACEVNGEHTLTIETLSHLEKGQRIVYCDDCGKFREFIVQEIIEDHEDGAITTTATCEDSLAELNGDYLVEKEPTGTASAALSVALGTSRWQVGRVDVTGSKHFSFYHCSAREAVNEIAEAFGGEVSATIEVAGGYITARKANVTKRVGADNGKRFTYRKDLSEITRTVEIDDVVTALYGYGKGLEQVDENGEATGGFDRKLTFGEVNNGLDYVYDSDALERWGRPDGKGGKAHVFGRVEFSDCEDKHELLTLTQERFEAMSEPRISYSASVINMRAAGFVAEGVSEGDTVQIVDEAFEPPLRLSGRILKIVEDLLAPEETVITLGNIQANIAGTILEMGQSVHGIKNHASSWDGAASISSAFIDAVLKRLNEEFDAGGSYKYESFEIGTIYSSVPLDENFKPKRTPATAFQLTGMGFRIADGTKSNGEFDWRTIGTGAGFTADCLTAGEIRGGSNRWNLETGDLEFMQGGIRDSKGNNSWNLDTGEFTLSPSASVGSSTAADLAVSVDVQYGLSPDASTQPTSWTTTALWQQGKHLWTRTKMTLADGSVQYSAARRIANDKGIGASEVTEQYYLSTSKTTQTGGSWQNSQPTWVKGRYYWTRSRISWSDGTVTYTTPQLARALTAANQSTNDLDDELTQREIFNRLTNNGATQGIYMSNGLLYINATYLKTGVISDAAGRNTWNLNTGALSTNYMTANNIDAKGTFECGSTSAYGIRLNSSGQLSGYRQGSQVGYIDYSASSRDVSTGAISYGLQLQAQGIVRISSPKMATAATSNVGTTATYGSTGDIWVAGFTSNPGSWRLEDLHLYQINFINGLCTSGNVS